MVWPESDPEAQAQIAAFRDGLQTLGWAEGRNIRLDVRWSSAEVAVIQRFAKELTDLQPDVFLATGLRRSMPSCVRPAAYQLYSRRLLIQSRKG
jgi:hypothetical protein